MARYPSTDYAIALGHTKVVHATTKFYSGNLVKRHAKHIKALIERLGIKTVLDYGCGKGAQYQWLMKSGKTLEQYWGVKVTKYDPGVPEFAAKPRGKFDLVIVSHVLFHIPSQDREWLIDCIYGLAKKAVFIAEGLWPAKKTKAAAVDSELWGAKRWTQAVRRNRPKGLYVELAITERPGGRCRLVVTSD